MSRSHTLTKWAVLLLLLVPQQAFMTIPVVPQTVDTTSTCFFGGLSGGGIFCNYYGAAGLANFVETTLFTGAQYAFLGAAIVLFLYYGLRLILESNEESTISEVKSAYSYGIAGAAIVSLATIIVQSVGQQDTVLNVGSNTTQLVNVVRVGSVLGNVELYLRIMVATAVSAVIVYQGMRLIILEGEESEFEKQKTRFFHTLIGVAIILLANSVITAFVPPAGGGSGNALDFAAEIAGIGNYLLVLIGGLAVLAFLVAGFLLVVSTSDELKDRAKKIIFSTIITMIIILASYAIVHFVLTLPNSAAS